MKQPYVILDFYYPQILPPDKWNIHKGWRAWRVGEDICAITKKAGLKPLYDPAHPAQTWPSWHDTELHAEVKKWTPEHPGGECWHYDGDTTPGANSNCCLVLWASNTPTEIKLNGSNKVWQPKPFQIVIFNNMHCTHHRPENCPKDRFLFRQRVEVPHHIKLP